jgi:hypothetical protein
MESVVRSLRDLLPDIGIKAGDNLHWSPENQSITYRLDDSSEDNIWGLIHEAGHATLGHHTYSSDMELLQLEVAAWSEAEKIAKNIGIKIDPDHIQDCLDTYRDWLHQRSTCPRCGVVSFQESSRTYQCYTCRMNWTVSTSRFCRPYRLGTDKIKNRPEIIPQAVFQEKAAN